VITRDQALEQIRAALASCAPETPEEEIAYLLEVLDQGTGCPYDAACDACAWDLGGQCARAFVRRLIQGVRDQRVPTPAPASEGMGGRDAGGVAR
jgi:hypothetical protein